jgi:hypothetical protein
LTQTGAGIPYSLDRARSAVLCEQRGGGLDGRTHITGSPAKPVRFKAFFRLLRGAATMEMAEPEEGSRTESNRFRVPAWFQSQALPAQTSHREVDGADAALALARGAPPPPANGRTSPRAMRASQSHIPSGPPMGVRPPQPRGFLPQGGDVAARLRVPPSSLDLGRGAGQHFAASPPPCDPSTH